MVKYRLGDIAPVKQGSVPDNEQYWLLNLDVVESNTGTIMEYLYVDITKIKFIFFSQIIYDDCIVGDSKTISKLTIQLCHPTRLPA